MQEKSTSFIEPRREKDRKGKEKRRERGPVVRSSLSRKEFLPFPYARNHVNIHTNLRIYKYTHTYTDRQIDTHVHAYVCLEKRRRKVSIVVQECRHVLGAKRNRNPRPQGSIR